jgi:hypothetical protein
MTPPNFPTQFFANPIVNEQGMSLSVTYSNTIPSYIFGKIPSFGFGLIEGVLFSNALTLMRILAKIDKEDNLLLNPFVGDPVNGVNQLLFSFWKASSSNLGYFPLFLIVVMAKDTVPLPVYSYNLYLMLIFTTFLSITFPYALIKTSSIIKKSKDLTLEILKNVPDEIYQYSKNNSKRNVTAIISEIRQIREIPIKGILMQSAQFLLSAVIAILGLAGRGG